MGRGCLTFTLMTLSDQIKFVYANLSVRHRWAAVVSCLLALAATALDIVGVGMIYPITQILTGGPVENQPGYVQRMSEILGTRDIQTLALVAIGGLAFLLAVKGGFRLVSSYWTTKMLKEGENRAKTNLYAHYLSAGLDWHNAKHSGEMIHKLQSSCQVAFYTSVNLVIGLVSDTILTVGLIGALIYTSPAASLVTMAVGIIGFLITHRILAKAIGKNALDQQVNNRRVAMQLVEMTDGVREIKVFASEKPYYQEFRDLMNGQTSITAKNVFFNESPRIIFEVIAGLYLFFVVLILMQTASTEAIIPTLAFFGVAAMRFLPATARITSFITDLRRVKPAIMELQEEVEAFGVQNFADHGVDLSEDRRTRRLAFTKSIDFSNVTFSYDHGKYALSETSLAIPRGHTVGIVGPSGAGKSTIVGLLLGLYQPQSGEILVDGKPMDPNLSPAERSIGYVAQSPYILDGSIRRNVAFGYSEDEIDDDRVREALNDAHLLDFVNEMENGLETLVGQQGVRLSGGQRQRLAIARALYRNPEMLIFDEATSALDMETESRITAVLNELGGRKTIVVIAHRLSTVRGCDHIYFMKDGSVRAEGTFDQLASQDDEFQNLVRLGQL